MYIPIYNTYINPLSYKKVKEVLDSTFLSEGKIVEQFENKIKKEFALLYPVALNSGTSALHLSMILSQIKPGDEVILPAQTFIATGLAILYEKAIPVFADIQYETGNISPYSIKNKITKKTKAIIAVHWGGNPCDLNEIHAIAKEHNLIVIEDAAHALGASYKNKPIGAISDFTCFSFQAIKHLTTGDGGAICMREKKVAERAKSLRWFGIDRKKSKPSILGERQYNIHEPGYKYHMNDYAAALGIANLKNLKQRINNRRKIAGYYRRALAKINGISLFEEMPDRKSSYWQFGFHVERRNDFIRALASRGIITSVIHQRIDRNNVFGGINKDLVNQERFDTTQIHIPIHDGVDEEKSQYIIEAIKHGW